MSADPQSYGLHDRLVAIGEMDEAQQRSALPAYALAAERRRRRLRASAAVERSGARRGAPLADWPRADPGRASGVADPDDIALLVRRSTESARHAKSQAAATCRASIALRCRVRAVYGESAVLRAQARSLVAPRAPHARSTDDLLRSLADLTRSVQAMLGDGAPTAPPARPALGDSPLSPRQLEILRLIADGRSTEQVASRLFLTVATVRNHVARALRALDAHSRVEAIAKARRLELL